MLPTEELTLQLEDGEWPLTYIDHRRDIARAIVVDVHGSFHFMRVRRNDIFGHGSFIETSGGGIEAGEEPHTAILRELEEELGIQAEILCKLGTVDDYYNLIHRHNRNHYFLCRALSFGQRHPTQQEREQFDLTPLCLSYEEALAEYEACAAEKWGRLLAQREVPMLQLAKQRMDENKKTDL